MRITRPDPIDVPFKLRIVGHGLEHEGTFYCCAHCAEAEGVTVLTGRA